MADIERGDGHLQPYQRAGLGRLARGRDHWHQGMQEPAGFYRYVAFVITEQAKRRAQLIKVIPASQQPATGDPVVSQVHEGRWVALCECGGAEVVDPEEPYFYCFSCHNVINGGRPRPVDFPAQWRAIERTLLARPKATQRGYIPSETLYSLRAENVARGLPETV